MLHRLVNRDPASIDWSPTTAQWLGLAAGLAIGGTTIARDDLSPASKAAFVAAYAVACGVIPRLRGVVRHRRVAQFSAHQVAMATITGVWLAEGQPGPAAFNGLWLASAGAWWLTSRRAA